MERIRKPVAAGSFYPAREDLLKRMIEDCFLDHYGPGELPFAVESRDKRTIVGLISPHAGYLYSGPVAAHGFSQISKEQEPDTIVIVGPNHTGIGPPVSVYPAGRWKTPLGDVKVNVSLAEKIVGASELFSSEYSAHISEHSIEVQLPFLQFIFQDKFEIVPICMGDQTIKASFELGDAIARAAEGERVLVIASTDLTHYESLDRAKQKDQEALARILRMDARGLLETVSRLQISMCGAGPVAAMLVAADKMGAGKARVLSYQTSGNVTGDNRSVVGYASVVVLL